MTLFSQAIVAAERVRTCDKQAREAVDQHAIGHARSTANMRINTITGADVLTALNALSNNRPQGSVAKFEPLSGSGEMEHAQEAVGQLIVAVGNSAIDLELAEHALDAVALLVERPVMIHLNAAV